MPKSDQGALLDRYTVIPRTLIFVTRGSDVLLLRGAPTKRLWANLYNGIGGHVERGEDVLSAARRELREETGLVEIDIRLVGTVLVDAERMRGIALYVLRGLWRAGEVVESPEGSLEWVPFDQVNDLPLVEDLRVILPVILNMQPESPPFSALYSYDGSDRLQISFGA